MKENDARRDGNAGAAASGELISIEASGKPALAPPLEGSKGSASGRQRAEKHGSVDTAIQVCRYRLARSWRASR